MKLRTSTTKWVGNDVQSGRQSIVVGNWSWIVAKVDSQIPGASVRLSVQGSVGNAFLVEAGDVVSFPAAPESKIDVHVVGEGQREVSFIVTELPISQGLGLLSSIASSLAMLARGVRG